MCKAPTAEIVSPGLRVFTWAEIDKSVPKKISLAAVAAQPSYVVIHGKVYDLGGDFVKWHPGGAVAISQLGKDASDAFDVFHKASTHETLANYYVGDLAESEAKKPTGFARDVQELRAQLDKLDLYKSNKLWYAGKVIQTASIAVLSVSMLALWGGNILGVVASAAICALFFQQSGWLAHDFLHHQVFENRDYNNYAGLLIGNVFQGFSVAWWKHKHSTHHSVPNVHEQDPDIDTLPFLAWSEHALEGFADFDDTALAKFMVTYQPIIYFPLLSFARMAWALQSIMWQSPNSRKAGHFPTMSGAEKVCIALHYSWYLGAAFYFAGPVYGLIWALLSQCICGILLASVFSVNHNGMPVYSTDEAKNMDYYELSIVTGRNVIPSTFNNWFTGGLNFQIEHHMFPTIPRHNLPKIAPMVRDLCAKHGVMYHTTSLPEGLGEVVARLTKVAGMARRVKRE